MNFTREPLIETVITPKEGYKLIVRNSKVSGLEEYFVDAVEVISFGKATFFRSLEKPKCFLVPVTDYEILEARESRMVLKTPGSEKSVKIAGGREAPMKVKEETPTSEESTEPRSSDKRRDRRRSRKRRKGEFEEDGESSEEALEAPLGKSDEKGEEKRSEEKKEEKRPERPSLIPPPSTLISETIARYKAAEEQTKEPRVLIPPPPPPSEDEDKNDEEIPF